MKKVLICLKIVVPALMVAAALQWCVAGCAKTLRIDQVRVSLDRLPRSMTTNDKVIDAIEDLISEGIKVRAGTQ